MRFDVTRLTRLARVGPIALSPCGRWAVTEVARLDADDARYIGDLWRVDLQNPDAPPVALTPGPNDDRAPAFRQDGALLFLTDRKRPAPHADEGEGRRQIWLLPAEGGEPRPLTDEPLGVLDFQVAGDRLVVRAPMLANVPHDAQRQRFDDQQKHGPSVLHYRRQRVRHWDQWIAPPPPHLIACDAAGRDRHDLTPYTAERHQVETHWALSPDGLWVVAHRGWQDDDHIYSSELIAIHTPTGATTTLGRARHTTFEHPLISPDSREVVCVRHTRSREALGRPTLWRFQLPSAPDPAERALGDVATSGAAVDPQGEAQPNAPRAKEQPPAPGNGQHLATAGRPLASDWDAWPRPVAWSPDGRTLWAVADTRGQVPVYAVDLESGEVTRHTDADASGCHDHLRATPDGEALLGVRHTLLQPPELTRISTHRDSPDRGVRPERLTHLSGLSAAEAAGLGRIEEIECHGADGAPVHGYLIRPGDSAQVEDRATTLLWIHGGPIGQHVDGWHWRWNVLLAAASGYTVALPNPRGSTGYGQRFIEGIWQNRWGAECYTDLMAFTDHLGTLPDIDSDRMVAMGGSFGGYMTNWIGGQTKRFRCLVTHASIYDIGAFNGTTDDPGWLMLEMSGAPDENLHEFNRYSPHRNLHAWRTPTLILHGERDYRVPISEALTLFENLQRRRVPSELVVFPDEGHWIQRPRNIRAWYDTWMSFVDRWVG